MSLRKFKMPTLLQKLESKAEAKVEQTKEKRIKIKKAKKATKVGKKPRKTIK